MVIRVSYLIVKGDIDVIVATLHVVNKNSDAFTA